MQAGSTYCSTAWAELCWAMAAGPVIHISRGQSRLNPLLGFAPLKLFIEKLWDCCSCGDAVTSPYHPIYYLFHNCFLNWKSRNSSQRETLCHAWGWHGRERPGGPHCSPQKPIIHHCAPVSRGMTGFNVWYPRESSTPSHRGCHLWSLDLSDSHKHSWRAKKKKDHSSSLTRSTSSNFSKMQPQILDWWEKDFYFLFSCFYFFLKLFFLFFIQLQIIAWFSVFAGKTR